MTSVQGTDFWASFLKHFRSQPWLLKSSELLNTLVHKVTQLGLETQGQENILALLPTRVQLIDPSQESEEKLGQSLYLAPGAPNTEQALWTMLV